MEVCNECGRAVRWGAGWFVNRVPDADTVGERQRMGKPYPHGDFVCAECDVRECGCAYQPGKVGGGTTTAALK